MWVCPSEGKTKIFFIGEERMKRTFKKVLSTVVASLFVLQSASLATVGIGATGTNEVLKSTPTLDGTKDEAYAASWGYTDTVSWGSVDFSFLYDDEYLYVYADIKNNARGEYDALDMALMVTDNPNNNWTDVHSSTEVVSNPFWTDGTAMACRHYTNIMDYVETGDNLGWQPGRAPKGATHQGETPASEYSLTATNTGAILEYRIKNTKGAFVKGATVSFAATDSLNGWPALWNATDYTTFVLGEKYTPTHEHEWAAEYTTDVEPTCLTDGSKSIHCSICDAINRDTVTPVDALGHNWSDEYTEVPATCSVPGARYRACLRTGCDGRTDVTVLKTTPHNFVGGVCTMCNSHEVLKSTPTIDGVKDEAYDHSYSWTYDGNVTWGSYSLSVLYDDDYFYVYLDIENKTSKGMYDAVDMALILNGDSTQSTDVATNPYLDSSFHCRHYNNTSDSSAIGNNIVKQGNGTTSDTEYKLVLNDDGAVLEYRIKGKFAAGDLIAFATDPGTGAWGKAQSGDYKAMALGAEFTPAHEHVFSDEWSTDVKATCTKMGVKSHHCTVAGCDVVSDQTDIPKVPHTAGKLTTTEPTCVEEGKTTSVCTICGSPFTVGEPTPALGHSTTSGKCERCGEYVNAPSNVPYATAVVDGVKDVAYDSGAKYYVNGATAYLLYDRDYFYIYVEADDAEEYAYFTIGNPNADHSTGAFWTHTASLKLNFTSKSLWVSGGMVCQIYNEEGKAGYSGFGKNLVKNNEIVAVDGEDYSFATTGNAVEYKIYIGPGSAENNYIGKASVGNNIYYIGLGTKTDGISLDKEPLHVQLINGDCTNVVLDKCLDGCTDTESIVTVEPTCDVKGVSIEKCTVCGAELEGSENEIPALGHDWTYDDIETEPTCTDEGLAHIKVCKRTGCTTGYQEDYEEGFIIPALGHDYVYTCDPTQKNSAYKAGHIGTCKTCGAVSGIIAHNTNELGICADCGANVSLIPATYSVTLLDVINLNVKINKASVEAYDNFYVKFVEHYKDTGTDNVQVVTDFTYESNTSRYVFAYGAAPQCAIDDVDVYVYGVKDGVTYESTIKYTRSIKTYLYSMLARSTDEALNTLMVQLLDYISAAQTFTGYETANLANAELTDAMKAYRLPENTNYSNTAGTTVNEGVSGVTYKARSLYCFDSIAFKYNFTIDDSQYNTDNIKVVVKYKDDGVVMAEYTGDQIVYDSARSRYVVTVGVKAHELSSDLEVNVYTLDGTLISNKTLVNSIESMIANYAKDADYTDFVAAIMQYGRAAAAYANR